MTDQHVTSYISRTVPALQDNYIHFITKVNGDAIIVDPSESKPVFDTIARYQLNPVAIFNTHHHHDHIGGNDRILSQYDIPVYGPPKRIHHVTKPLYGGEKFELLGLHFTIYATPGHTRDHITFHALHQTGVSWLFVGDALFYLGVGRMFEGEGPEMWQYLKILRSLNPHTMVFCGHEYSNINAEFTLKYAPNIAQHHIITNIVQRHNIGEPTVPYSLKSDKMVNLFLNCDNQEIKNALDMPDALPEEVFVKLRQLRNDFVL